MKSKDENDVRDMRESQLENGAGVEQGRSITITGPKKGILQSGNQTGGEIYIEQGGKLTLSYAAINKYQVKFVDLDVTDLVGQAQPDGDLH